MIDWFELMVVQIVAGRFYDQIIWVDDNVNVGRECVSDGLVGAEGCIDAGRLLKVIGDMLIWAD